MMILNISHVKMCYERHKLAKYLSLEEVLGRLVSHQHVNTVIDDIYLYLNNDTEIIEIEDIQHCIETTIAIFYQHLSNYLSIDELDKWIVISFLNRSDVIIEREPP